jgi:putative intracellular protease/amidase
MKTAYLYVLDTLADWEPGYVVAELNSGRYLERKDWRVRTCALERRPVVTLGGVTIVPDATIAEVTPAEAGLLILPGADTWMEPRQAPALAKVRELLAAGVPVAAICGATGWLAEAGLLDDVRHTSNGLEYLHLFCPHYRGDANYRDELAVTDGNLITAGSSAPVEFAYHVFKKLGVFKPEDLERWYAYFGKHSIQGMLELLQARQGQAAGGRAQS